MTKNEMRRQYTVLRDSLSRDEIKRFSGEIHNRLLQTKAYRECGFLLVYLSFRSEVDTRDMIAKALSDGKKVYLPRIVGKDMEFYEIHDLKGLQVSPYGIEEPPEEECNRFTRESPGDIIFGNKKRNQEDTRYHNLMLLPGLAFDTNGNRIGYGAGFYDRYLASHAGMIVYKIGLAYDLQVAEHIEAEAYDVKADCLLTPTRLIYMDNTKQ